MLISLLKGMIKLCRKNVDGSISESDGAILSAQREVFLNGPIILCEMYVGEVILQEEDITKICAKNTSWTLINGESMDYNDIICRQILNASMFI